VEWKKESEKEGNEKIKDTQAPEKWRQKLLEWVLGLLAIWSKPPSLLFPCIYLFRFPLSKGEKEERDKEKKRKNTRNIGIFCSPLCFLSKGEDT
jgi:hypothetical protein